MFLRVLTSIYPLQVYFISLTRFKEFRKFWPCYFVDTFVKVPITSGKSVGSLKGLTNRADRLLLG